MQKLSEETSVTALTEALEAAEEWLYDEGDSTTLGVYKAKLKELKAIADVIFVPLEQYLNPTPLPTLPPAPDNGTSVNATVGEDGEATADEPVSD